MNTYLNILEEFGSLKDRIANRIMGVPFINPDREHILSSLRKCTRKVGLNRIITMRGNKEQYNVKYFTNYPSYAAQTKRRSRSYVPNLNHA